jgi:hypothetical protein
MALGKEARFFETLLEILSFTCNQMLPSTTNGCLCKYFSNLNEVWSSFQLGCDYDLFHL